MALSEFAMIEQLFKQQAAQFPLDPQLILGIGDDAAIINPIHEAQSHWAISTDTLVVGTHFFADDPPQWIGHKSLAVNLSDLAAMGAQPRWFTLSLTLPALNPVWLSKFSEGLFQLARAHAIQLIGGNTTQGPLSITIQVMGDVSGCGLARSSAKANDDIWVTGCLGGAGWALQQLLASHDRSSLIEKTPALFVRYYQPQPRVAAGLVLRSLAHAAIDLSDGLLGDLSHLCLASGLGADIWLDQLPVDDAVKDACDATEALRLALTAGEDYELCFTAAVDQRSDILQCLAQQGLLVSRIGQMRLSSGVCYFSSGDPIDLSHWSGFEHFKAI